MDLANYFLSFAISMNPFTFGATCRSKRDPTAPDENSNDALREVGHPRQSTAGMGSYLVKFGRSG